MASECDVVDKRCKGKDLFMEDIPDERSYTVKCTGAPEVCMDIRDLYKSFLIYQEEDRKITSGEESGNRPSFINPYNRIPYSEKSKVLLKEKGPRTGIQYINKNNVKDVNKFINDFCVKISKLDAKKKDTYLEDYVIDNEIIHQILLDTQLSKSDKKRLIQCFIDAKVNVNITYSYDAYTPLFLATKLNYGDIVRLLLDAGGAKPDLKSENKTPLYVAADYGYTDIVRLLLETGANPDIPEHRDRTPLYTAALLGNVEIAKLLLDGGAKPDIPDKDGWTPLNTAALLNHIEIVKLLLGAKADPNIVSKNKHTPLLTAVQYGHKEIVELLLKAGANFNVRDASGWTPLILAKSMNYPEIVELLSKAKAKS